MAFEDARGVRGTIRAGGRDVARLVDWVAVRDGKADTWTIGGGVQEVNDVLLATAREFEVCLEMGKQPWRWRRVPRADVTFHGTTGFSAVTRGRFER